MGTCRGSNGVEPEKMAVELLRGGVKKATQYTYLFLPSFMFKHDVLMYSSFYFEYDSTSPLRMIPPPSRIKID